MKKAIFYIIGFIIIVFILPVIFTTSPKSQETIAQEENQKQDTEEKNIKTEDMNPYYLKYQKIKLFLYLILLYFYLFLLVHHLL